AEDGIRDFHVTGVQTCALPISLDAARAIIQRNRPGTRLLRYLMLRMNNQILKAQYDVDECGWLSSLNVSSGCRPFDTMPFCTSRSEERRVGQECRSRWWRYASR